MLLLLHAWRISSHGNENHGSFPVRCRHRLPGGAVGTPPLEGFKAGLDGAWADWSGGWQPCPRQGGLELDDLWGPFQSKLFYDSMITEEERKMMEEKSPSACGCTPQTSSAVVLGKENRMSGEGDLEEIARTAEHSCCLHMHEEEVATPGHIIQVMCHRRPQITV